MRLIRSLSPAAIAPGQGRVLTIGAFDGLHLGHQAIFDQARSLGRSLDTLSVLSFEPTPSEFFAGIRPPARLTCFREKFEILDSMGVDELICPDFGQVKSLAHQRFVEEILVNRLMARHIVVGHDFRYGEGRQGSVETLRTASAELGFGLTVVEPVDLDGQRISSTVIRQALGRGDLKTARRMLGRDYSMSGRVVHGLGLGRDFGFPTANVNLKRRKAPVDGIFAVQVAGLGPSLLEGVASVGSRPTVGGGKTLLEVFIFDFTSMIYGAYIQVRFLKRLRSEEKFDSVDAMKTQMHRDVDAAKAALRG